MKREDIKRSLDNIRPPESLITATAEKVCRVYEREARPSYSGFKMKYALASVCACLLLIMSAGFVYTAKTRPYTVIGSFSPDSGYVTAVAPFSLARMVTEVNFVDNAAYDEAAYYDGFYAEVSAMQGEQISVVADARVEQLEIYTQSENESLPSGLCMMQLRFTSVIAQSDNVSRSYRERDSLTVAIWLDVPASEARLPETGGEYRFFLYTGADGSPTDQAASAAGLKDVYMMYGCYVPDGADG